MKIEEMRKLLITLESIDQAMSNINNHKYSNNGKINDRLRGSLIEMKEETVMYFEYLHGVYIEREGL